MRGILTSMVALGIGQASQSVVDPDQRVRLHGLSWKELELILAIRGDQAGARVAFLRGELELMSPSRSHEGIKTTMGRMLEAWALAAGIELQGFGSWTLKDAPRECAAEPDECYIVGATLKDRPDLAIEVMWTSGGIDKLEIYRGLEVGEVWIWRDGAITVYLLQAGQYAPAERSQVLPELDLGLMASCLTQAPTQTAAVKQFLAALGH